MLSKNLKEIRNKRKLSFRALAEKSGVSKSTLNDIENNNVKSTTLATLEKISDALGVSLNYLTGESIDSVLETRLQELEMTYEDLAEQSGLQIGYLERLSDVHPDEGDYDTVKHIALILKLNPESLITALAKQEPPLDDNPTTYTREEILNMFSDEDDVAHDSPLSESEVFTLAAKFINYEEPLTELDIEKMKMSLKIALAKVE